MSFLAGEEMLVDYGEGALTLLPGTHHYKKPRLFVATLRHSRRSFHRVVWTSTPEGMGSTDEQAFRYFGFMPPVFSSLSKMQKAPLKHSIFAVF